jgi:hypothetical protein
MIEEINCLITDVIRITLSTCDYRDCNELCKNYLINVAYECPVVFHNEVYESLWNTLFNICFSTGEEINNYLSN